MPLPLPLRHAITEWTATMVRALPEDGNRYEVIDGELFVTPAPTWRHQRAIRDVSERLRDYLRSHPIGDLIFAPADVEFSVKRLVEPDIFVVPLVDGRVPQSWEDVRRLLLVVEVLSPSSARADRDAKRRLYQREGVPEYWVIDVDARVVERWRPEDARPEILTETLEWRPDGQAPPLAIELPAYFAGVVGE